MFRKSLWVGVLAVCGSATAAEKPVEELLKNMRRAYQAVHSASLAVKLRRDDEDGVSSGLVTVDYVAPNRLRYASRVGTNDVRRFSNGKQVVTIRPGSREKQDKVDVDTLGGQVAGNLEWLCFFDWKRQLSTTKGANMAKSRLKIGPVERWQGQSWIILEEAAPEMGLSVRYFIDPKTFFIWRCDVHRYDTKKRVVMTQIQKLKLGVNFPPAHFEPPAEARVKRVG